MIPEKYVERFWSKVKKAHGEGCWEWTAGKYKYGYGVFHVARKPWLAHRLSFFLAHGEIPKGKFICHHCDNPPCCRPDHLFLGDPVDNTADMIHKGRDRFGEISFPGEKNCKSKLTEAQALAIRDMEIKRPNTIRKVAASYGVSVDTVSLIRRRKLWKHLKEAA